MYVNIVLYNIIWFVWNKSHKHGHSTDLTRSKMKWMYDGALIYQCSYCYRYRFPSFVFAQFTIITNIIYRTVYYVRMRQQVQKWCHSRKKTLFCMPRMCKHIVYFIRMEPSSTQWNALRHIMWKCEEEDAKIDHFITKNFEIHHK